jgi:tRNA modification GTPase
MENLERVQTLLDQIRSQMKSRHRPALEYRVAIVGQSNVGKSSLLNALVGQQAALVSPQAGTTRDYLYCVRELAGIPVQLTDTAGWENDVEGNEISTAARQLSDQQSETAELRLLCLDASRPCNDRELHQVARIDVDQLVVWTKCDQIDQQFENRNPVIAAAIRTSSLTGLGLDQLRTAIARRLRERETETNVVAGTASRCGESLRQAADHLSSARHLAESCRGEELVSAELRGALEELGKVVGTVYTEDVLDRIFSRFCIGK